MQAPSILTIVKVLVAAIGLAASLKELIVIAKKLASGDSFQAINQWSYEELMPPVITLCPSPAWKRPGPFLSDEEFLNSTYAWAEIFHPQTLTQLQNKTLFEIKHTYASYYGRVFL